MRVMLEWIHQHAYVASQVAGPQTIEPLLTVYTIMGITSNCEPQLVLLLTTTQTSLLDKFKNLALGWTT